MDPSFKIERGVAVPAARKRITRYPFAEMEIGDSFLAPVQKATSAASAARIYGRINGRKLVARREGDDGAVRIWRVA